jgi:hypothetical protein
LAAFFAVLVALAAIVPWGGSAAKAAPAPARINTAIATTTECDGRRKNLRITLLLIGVRQLRRPSQAGVH